MVPKCKECHEDCYPAIGFLTVPQIFGMCSIPDSSNRRLDRYNFTDDGNRCAYWVSQPLSRHEGEKYLAPGQANSGMGCHANVLCECRSQALSQDQGGAKPYLRYLSVGKCHIKPASSIEPSFHIHFLSICQISLSIYQKTTLVPPGRILP